MRMTFSLDDVQSMIVDADEDGRNESLMMIFPDQTLLCVSDNDGDGVADYAAVDVHLTRVVDFAAHSAGETIDVRRQYEGAAVGDFERFDEVDFAEDFSGWAELLGLRFPNGTPNSGVFEQTLEICNNALAPEWTSRRVPWTEGGIYAFSGDRRHSSVAKVLKVDAVGVHIRHYSNRFEAFPNRIDERDLFLAPFDADGDSDDPPGMGHLPISARTFRAWAPVFVQQSVVRADELSGFEGWLDAEGGYF